LREDHSRLGGFPCVIRASFAARGFWSAAIHRRFLEFWSAAIHRRFLEFWSAAIDRRFLDGPLRSAPGEVRIGAGSGDENRGRSNKAAMNRRTPKLRRSAETFVVSITSSKHFCLRRKR
jgi:hypothetical protein